MVHHGGFFNKYVWDQRWVSVHTPASNLILNGITRQVVLSLCYDLSIPVDEKPFTLEEAYEMDELFLTSTTSEVMPITTIDGRTIGSGVPGKLTIKLQNNFKLEIPAFAV